MKKSGKISIRFFLNKKVKPQHIPLLGNSDFYPVYVQITYGRKNTQFRVQMQRLFLNIEDPKGQDHKDLEYEKELIKMIIDYEVESKKKRFQLEGLKDRYRNYVDEIGFSVEKYLRNTMLASLESSNSIYKMILDPTTHWEVPLSIYFDAAAKLESDIQSFLPENFKNEMIYGEDFKIWCQIQKNSPRQIEWLHGSAKNRFRLFQQKKGYSENQIIEQVEFVNRAVEFTVKDDEL